MPAYHWNEKLFSEIYLEEITAQPEREEVLASLRVLREYRDYAETDSLNTWVTSYIHEVLAALGFNPVLKTDALTLLNPMGTLDQPVSLCYVTLPEEDLDNTTIGRNWAEKVIRSLREQELQWGLLTNGKLWRIYHLDEPMPYETYFEIDLDTILTNQAQKAYQIFHKFMKAENFVVDEEKQSQFDRFKKESKDKVDYIENELQNALKQREEGGQGVLSDICMGYVEELRNAGEVNLDDEDMRQKIYHGAMLYMFRLLFLFYADARGLLSDDNHDLLQQAANKANSHHRGVETTSAPFSLWKLLEEIFVDIDQTYNGGLFSPQESEFTQFIEETQIKDQYLAPAFQHLTTYKESNGSVHPISYRDMGVRNLGTLYEGLLEHKLFIAQENTEIRITRSKIRFIPESKGGKIRVGKYLPAGSVYFASDPSERKSSGSYYTPEFIVDYIVSNSVGKTLKELFNEFLRDEKENISALTHSIDENEHIIIGKLLEENALSFVKQKILNLSVLDPAMGSGHFLLNSTNLISNKITEFLNLHQFEGSIDTGTTYWRRWVVENCIYGVDINPLAVELAKLSLWILSMAKNQPLSFLNHHLKCGNSLVGSRLEDIGNYPFSQKRNGITQISLFEDDPNFLATVESVVSKSSLIAKKASIILDDVKYKKEILDAITKELAHYINIADIHTSLFFGNQLSVEEYFKKINSEDTLNLDADFFHWQLEFPEIFVNQSGFDCVVGNPPYVNVSESDYSKKNLQTSKSRNLFSYFVEIAIRNLRSDGGRLGFIIPISIVCSSRMDTLRKLINKQHGSIRFVNVDSSAHPGVLFPGLTLILSLTFLKLDANKDLSIESSNITKFYNDERETFLDDINFIQVPKRLYRNNMYPKIGNEIEISILDKMFRFNKNILSYEDREQNDNYLFYKGTVNNYIQAFSTEPFFEVGGKQVKNSKTKTLSLHTSIDKYNVISLFWSSTFYWFWTLYSNIFDFLKSDIQRFPIDLMLLNKFSNKLNPLAKEIEEDLQRHAKLVEYNKSSGLTRYYQLKPRRSKHLFDLVDEQLGEYYQLSTSEIDFIKSFNLRFREDDRD